MVLHYESPVRVYKSPFELVMAAYERRFPTCPLIPVFIGSEILSENETPDLSSKTIERRCKIHVDAPFVLKKLAGVDYVLFHQKNELNRKNRTLDITVKNESFTNRIILTETCRYYVHPENSEWTCYEQRASLEVISFFGFESTIEKLAMKQYSQSVAKGKEVIEYYLKKLKDENITYIKPWAQSIDESNNDDCTKNSENELVEKVECVNIANPAFTNVKKQSSISPSNSIENPMTLEADYIQRYLGVLTPLQESQLVQFKKSFMHSHKEKVILNISQLPNDFTLLRFLKARDFNLEKARELLAHSLIWRKKHNVDQILSDYQIPEVVKDYFPGGWHHYDKDSRPLYILRLGLTDVKGLLKSVGENGLLKLVMHVCEEGIRLTKEATRVSGHPITTWCLLVDLEGLNMRHYWRPGIKALLRIIEIAEANYPETLGRVFIVRAPRVFPILWAIVQTFIDERTRSKFLLYGGNDYQEAGGLSEYIDSNIIPDFLGGPCKVKIGEGGIVPKNLYLPESDNDKEALILGDNSVYNSFTLNRGQVFEIAVNITDIGAVITWDFDVMRHDIIFTVFLINKKCEVMDGPISNSGSDLKSMIDKSWVEGIDYRKAEPTVVCHDGESVQGSHVSQFSSLFILQWKFSPTVINQLSQDGNDSIKTTSSSHKANVMYFYEILHSDDYKGSMSSLQSIQSSHSEMNRNCNIR